MNIELRNLFTLKGKMLDSNSNPRIQFKKLLRALSMKPQKKVTKKVSGE